MAKVVFVVPYNFLPPRNGGQQAAWGFATYLAQITAVAVVSTPGNQAPPTLPFQLLSWLESSVGRYISPRAAWKTLRFLRQQPKGCLLIVQQPFMALLMGLVARLSGAQLLVYSHNLEYLRFRSMGRWFWPLVYAIERWAYRRAQYVLFISADERQPAIQTFGLLPERCLSIPYGTALSAPPPGRAEARARIRAQHQLPPDAPIWLFFGPLSYAPNLQALDRILQEIVPYRHELGLSQGRIFICGGGLPEAYRGLEDYQNQGVSYLGFVPQLEHYLLAADLMLNLIESGAGIKTKVIEALAHGLPVVSTHQGALGVDPSQCGPMLAIAPDADYARFRALVKEVQTRPYTPTPDTFYNTYYWPNCLKPLIPIIHQA